MWLLDRERATSRVMLLRNQSKQLGGSLSVVELTTVANSPASCLFLWLLIPIFDRTKLKFVFDLFSSDGGRG
jgi:hypothetical protein